MRQDAELLVASARQLDFKNPVVHIAVFQPEVFCHPFHQHTKVTDCGVIVRLYGCRTHGGQSHHAGHCVNGGALVAQPVVEAQQAPHVYQHVAFQRLAGFIGSRSGLQCRAGDRSLL